MPKTAAWWWIVPILLISAAFTIPLFDVDSMWFDEHMSYADAGAPYTGGPIGPLTILQRVHTFSPVHVPGYYFILAGFSELTGWHLFTGRLLAMFLGFVSVAVTYRLAYRISNKDVVVAIGAAAAMALSGWTIFFMHEARMYTLMVLTGLLTVASYYNLLERHHPPLRAYAYLVLSGTALLYSHNFGVVTLGALGIYHLYRVREDGLSHRWMRTLISFALAGLLISPWAAIILGAIRNVRDADIAEISVLDLPEIWARMLYIFSNGSLLFVGLLLLSLRQRIPAFVWFWLGGSVVVASAMVLLLGTMFPRYLLGVVPPLAIIFGYCLRGLNTVSIRPLPVIGLWAVAAFFTLDNPEFNWNVQDYTLRSPIGEFSEAIGQEIADEDVVIYYLQREQEDIAPIHEPIMSYYFAWEQQTDAELVVLEPQVGDDFAGFDQLVTQTLADHDRVWVGFISPDVIRHWGMFNTRANTLGYVACGPLPSADEVTIYLFDRTNSHSACGDEPE